MPWNKLLFFALVISLFACNNERYGLMETPEETWLSDLCVAVPYNDLPYVLQMDKGEKIFPEGIPESNIEIGGRYNAYYSLVKPKQKDEVREAKIANLMPVTTIKMTYPESDGDAEEQYDPVEITKPFWLGGDYINVEFNFKMSDSKIKHKIKLVRIAFVEDSKALQLDFIHQANGDLAEQDLPAIVSFPLNSIHEYKQADTILVRVLEHNRSSQNSFSTYGLTGGSMADSE